MRYRFALHHSYCDSNMTNSDHPLHAFMDQMTSEMQSEYKRIYDRTKDDPGTAGDEGEENWASLLREWLPPTYHVATKGRIIGADGSTSPQVDVVVLKPWYPMKLREKRQWLATGVAAVFECKNTLKAEHVEALYERCAKTKSLFHKQRNISALTEMKSDLIYGLLAHSHNWKGPNSSPEDNIQAKVDQGCRQSRHPSDLPDVICVADLATWSVSHISRIEAKSYGDKSEDLKMIFGADWGPATAMMRASVKDNNQSEAFRPIGGALSQIIDRLSDSDESLAGLMSYFRGTFLMGSSAGNFKFWPQSVLSNLAIKAINDQYASLNHHADGGFSITFIYNYDNLEYAPALDRLLYHYRSLRVLRDWNGQPRLQPGDLVICKDPPNLNKVASNCILLEGNSSVLIKEIYMRDALTAVSH